MEDVPDQCCASDRQTCELFRQGIAVATVGGNRIDGELKDGISHDDEQNEGPQLGRDRLGGAPSRSILPSRCLWWATLRILFTVRVRLGPVQVVECQLAGESSGIS